MLYIGTSEGYERDQSTSESEADSDDDGDDKITGPVKIAKSILVKYS